MAQFLVVRPLHAYVPQAYKGGSRDVVLLVVLSRRRIHDGSADRDIADSSTRRLAHQLYVRASHCFLGRAGRAPTPAEDGLRFSGTRVFHLAAFRADLSFPDERRASVLEPIRIHCDASHRYRHRSRHRSHDDMRELHTTPPNQRIGCKGI